MSAYGKMHTPPRTPAKGSQAARKQLNTTAKHPSKPVKNPTDSN